MFEGKTLDEVEATPPEAVLDLLGREIDGTRLKCATLGLNTTKDAVRKLRAAGHQISARADEAQSHGG